MAFDFHKSMVGEYGELILSVLVMPRVAPGSPLPRSAFYPFLLGTTTKASRDHAIERWHLPHFMENIDLSFDAQDDEIRIAAAHGGSPIIDMRITDYDWEKVSHRYQSFMHDADGSYMSTIIMESAFSENEEERGDITIHKHAFNVGHRPRRRDHDAVPRALDARRPPDVPPARDAGRHGRLMAGRVCVIVNPAAGRGRGARTLPAVREAFAAVGVADVRTTEAREDERAVARRAIDEGFTTLVAVGGDGTWGNVANAILTSRRGRAASR